MIPGAVLLGHALRLMLSDTSANRNVNGTATAIYAVNSDGTVSKNGAFFEKWISIASRSGAYDVMATITAGALSAGSSATATWLPLSASSSWRVTNSARDDSTVTCNLFVQIRERSTGIVKVSANISLSATSRSTA